MSSIYSKSQITSHYEKFISTMSPNDVCFSWIINRKELGMMNFDELSSQIHIWNNCGKKLRCEEYNKKTYVDGNKTWYSFTLQEYDDKGKFIETDDANPLDPFALMKFGFGVNGYNYYFKDEQLRDAVVSAVNMGADLFRQKYDYCECCLCNKVFADINDIKNQKWRIANNQMVSAKHNAYPLGGEDEICCDDCNIKVLQARKEEVFRCEDADMEKICNECILYTKNTFNMYIYELFKRLLNEISNTEPYKKLYNEIIELYNLFRCEMSDFITINVIELANRIVKTLTISTISTIQYITTPTLLVIPNYINYLCERENLEQRIKDIHYRFECLHLQEQQKVIKQFEAEEKLQKQKKIEEDSKKSSTRNANKERDAKKREREEFERKAMECAREKARQDAIKKQKKAQQKAKASK